MPDEFDFIPQTDDDGWPIGTSEEDAHLGCAGRGYADENEPEPDSPEALAHAFHLD